MITAGAVALTVFLAAGMAVTAAGYYQTEETLPDRKGKEEKRHGDKTKYVNP